MAQGLFGLSEVAAAVRGQLELEGASRTLGSVSIDSRTVEPGSLFVPLTGARAEGHDFIEQAMAAGAAASLVSRRFWSSRRGRIHELAVGHAAGIVVVEDTLRALQALAAWHLRRLPGLVTIGITGSNGKTTTKELVGAALGASRGAAISPGNLNSETGLPLSCFMVRPGTRIAVFEMAMNHLGEIADLAEIVRPDFGLVTNIGVAHIGFCGTQEAIAREKKSIFRCFTGREVAFLPAGDRFFEFLARDVKGRIVPFGPGATRGFEKSENRGLDGSVIHWEGLRIRFPLVGRHNVTNALAAISVATELGVSREDVRDALESARPLPGRSEILRGNVTVIADCYNSSPESARELLELLGSLPRSGRRIGVFGSMLELGEESPSEHARLGQAAAAAGFDVLCFFGLDARDAYEVARRTMPSPRVHWTDDHKALAQRLRDEVRQGDLVVLKGSRGVELERVIPVLLPDAEVAACS